MTKSILDFAENFTHKPCDEKKFETKCGITYWCCIAHRDQDRYEREKKTKKLSKSEMTLLNEM